MRPFSDLPIYTCIDELKEKLEVNPIVVLEASPGAGKSTIVPLELIEETWLEGKKILMLQPRRIATRSVAERMASLLNEEVGKKIGYSIRHESKTSSKTKVEVVTEGVLLGMVQQDPSLHEIGLIIFDEFHERNIYSDFSFAVCKYIQAILRTDIKFLVMSATLEGSTRNYLSKFPFVTCEGRQFPITIEYENDDAEEPISRKCARKISQLVNVVQGDILVFLPGEKEIRDTMKLIEPLLYNYDAELGEGKQEFSVHPLYGNLDFNLQQRALNPDCNGKRKIILSTPVAETSVTIEGVTSVIDTGLVKRIRYDANMDVSRLETVFISKDSADQRAGRAGRLGPGTCYRLWTRGKQFQLNASRKPEILESDLSAFVLQLFNIGIYHFNELEWIDSIPDGHFLGAVELLKKLGFVESNSITEEGKKALALPAHPRLAKLFLHAEKLDKQTNDFQFRNVAIDLICLLEEKINSGGSDVQVLIEHVFMCRMENKRRNFNAVFSVSQFERMEKTAGQWRRRFSIPSKTYEVRERDIALLLSQAYPDRIAKKVEKDSIWYKLENGRIACLQTKEALLSHDWLICPAIDFGSKSGIIRLAAGVQIHDLVHLENKKSRVFYSDEKNSLIAQIDYCIGSITYKSIPSNTVTDEDRIKIFSELVTKNGLYLFNLQEKERNWLAKLAYLRKLGTDDEWPDLSETNLINHLNSWLYPYLPGKNSLRDLKEIPLLEAWKLMLGYERAELADKLLPDYIRVPSGSNLKITYFSDGRDPQIEVRIQEIFGLKDCPRINNGRTQILIHLLSPGYKPVQVTKDLPSFWNTLYPELRKELNRKYPKHFWPENPYEAQAVRGVKKK